MANNKQVSAKYFDRDAWQTGRRNESGKSSNGLFFTAKETDKNGNESLEYFNKYEGQELRIVGLAPQKGNGDIKPYNVVLFDDGHMLSTSRFFSAKGLKWPVGGNVGKFDYLTACIANGTVVKVTPVEVKTTTGTTNPAEGEEAREFTVATYYFEPVTLPPTDMSILQAAEEEEEA